MISNMEDFIEAGFLGIESANKLQVLYLFEKDIHFTDSFNETMKIINEDDNAWNNYLENIDSFPELNEEPGNSPLMRMAAALVHMHVARLELVYEEDDWLDTIGMVYALFQFQWDTKIKEWTHARYKWFTWLRRINL